MCQGFRMGAIRFTSSLVIGSEISAGVAQWSPRSHLCPRSPHSYATAVAGAQDRKGEQLQAGPQLVTGNKLGLHQRTARRSEPHKSLQASWPSANLLFPQGFFTRTIRTASKTRTEVKKTCLTFHAEQQVLWHSCPDKRHPLFSKAAGISPRVSGCASISSGPQLARNTQSWAPPCSLHFEERSRWRNCMSKLESQPAGEYNTEICAHGHKLLMTLSSTDKHSHEGKAACICSSFNRYAEYVH